MRTNFEKFTKRDSVVNEHGEQWQERRDRMKKRPSNSAVTHRNGSGTNDDGTYL